MRNGAGELSRGQGVKVTQVEVRKQTLSQGAEVHVGVRDPITGALGSRDHSAGQT